MQVSVFIGVTIDGFIAREDGGLDYLASFEAGDNGYVEFMATVDMLVVGRGTYDIVQTFPAWPWDGKRVVVVTHRPIDGAHGETAYAGELGELLARLAAEGTRRVYLDGGNLIRQGLDADLVDDMTITTVPRTIGRGIPLFAPIASHTRAWTIAASKQLDQHLAQVRWVRAR